MVDSSDDLSTWLKRFQSIDLEAAQVCEPAATAQRMAGLANAADRILPFGAEPSGFILAQRRLIRRGKAP